MILVYKHTNRDRSDSMNYSNVSQEYKQHFSLWEILCLCHTMQAHLPVLTACCTIHPLAFLPSHTACTRPPKPISILCQTSQASPICCSTLIPLQHLYALYQGLLLLSIYKPKCLQVTTAIGTTQTVAHKQYGHLMLHFMSALLSDSNPSPNCCHNPRTSCKSQQPLS